MQKAVITVQIETDNPEVVDSPTIMNAIYDAIKAKSPNSDITVRLPLTEIKWVDLSKSNGNEQVIPKYHRSEYE